MWRRSKKSTLHISARLITAEIAPQVGLDAQALAAKTVGGSVDSRSGRRFGGDFMNGQQESVGLASDSCPNLVSCGWTLLLRHV